MVTTALIFTGGIPPHGITRDAVRSIGTVDLVVAADSGLHTAQQLNMPVDAVIGDMDSVDAAALDLAQRGGAVIVRHDRNKDFTDTHAALLYSRDRGVGRIVVVTAGGGRLDHQLGLIAAMFDPLLASVRVEALWSDAHAYALQGPISCEFVAQLGDVVGLQAVGGQATGVSTRGLRWQLDNDSLPAHSTRGVSNEVTATDVNITVTTGQLLIIHHKSRELTI